MRLVVDSSVSLKWWLDDEEFIEESRLLLKKVVDGEIELILPELWYCEVANGITTAVRRNRISEKQGKMFIEELQAIPMEQYNIATHINRIYKDAVKYKYAIYDMVYLAIAELEEIQFISSDERLVNTVKSTKPFVKYVSDLKNILK
ncbi:MAG: type II toxin-antitoxin system VapC family toxin [Nitrospira sp.]|nr:type II toxin-antitoxin system VapC family toxin [Nitrospira sp.]